MAEDQEAPQDDPKAEKLSKARAHLSKALDPIEQVSSGQYRTLSNYDLRVVLAALRQHIHDLVSYMHEGGEVPEEPKGEDGEVIQPRNELADSKPNNPAEQAVLTDIMNPNLGVPAPRVGPGVVQSPVNEVTAPQSQPTPKIGGVTPVPAVYPTAALPADAVVNEAEKPEFDPNPLPIIPQPVVTSTDPNAQKIPPSEGNPDPEHNVALHPDLPGGVDAPPADSDAAKAAQERADHEEDLKRSSPAEPLADHLAPASYTPVMTSPTKEELF